MSDVGVDLAASIGRRPGTRRQNAARSGHQPLHARACARRELLGFLHRAACISSAPGSSYAVRACTDARGDLLVESVERSSIACTSDQYASLSRTIAAPSSEALSGKWRYSQPRDTSATSATSDTVVARIPLARQHTSAASISRSRTLWRPCCWSPASPRHVPRTSAQIRAFCQLAGGYCRPAKRW